MYERIETIEGIKFINLNKTGIQERKRSQKEKEAERKTDRWSDGNRGSKLRFGMLRESHKKRTEIWRNSRWIESFLSKKFKRKGLLEPRKIRQDKRGWTGKILRERERETERERERESGERRREDVRRRKEDRNRERERGLEKFKTKGENS